MKGALYFNSVLNLLNELNISVIVKGVEAREGVSRLRDAGVELMQAYHFAKPGFECLPRVDFSVV
ncbi:EAL domain-containing protein [Zhongshania sp. BJYM1]|uniref:EAL domain-containing protein n=1 Tax=Zhongshania aquatica TaxID=2965069 RepID=UPI0033130474